MLDQPTAPKTNLIQRDQAVAELTRLIPSEESWTSVLQKRIVEECIRRINMLPDAALVSLQPKEG